MGKIIKLFVGLIALMIVGIIGATVLSNSEGVVGDAASAAKNAAMNAALDASGAKNRIQEALESHAGSIAAATGLSEQAVQEGIAAIDVQNWQVADLPETAQVEGTFDGSAAGVDGTITTYSDPSYVTVDAYGQTVTLQAPQSALPYLGYLDYLNRL